MCALDGVFWFWMGWVMFGVPEGVSEKLLEAGYSRNKEKKFLPRQITCKKMLVFNMGRRVELLTLDHDHKSLAKNLKKFRYVETRMLYMPDIFFRASVYRFRDI